MEIENGALPNERLKFCTSKTTNYWQSFNMDACAGAAATHSTHTLHARTCIVLENDNNVCALSLARATRTHSETEYRPQPTFCHIFFSWRVDLYVCRMEFIRGAHILYAQFETFKLQLMVSKFFVLRDGNIWAQFPTQSRSLIFSLREKSRCFNGAEINHFPCRQSW